MRPTECVINTDKPTGRCLIHKSCMHALGRDFTCYTHIVADGITWHSAADCSTNKWKIIVFGYAVTSRDIHIPYPNNIYANGLCDKVTDI